MHSARDLGIVIVKLRHRCWHLASSQPIKVEIEEEVFKYQCDKHFIMEKIGNATICMVA